MPGKVLLVEDDPDFRAVLTLALELQGYQVHTATGGYQALEFLRRERPDIIISDLEMIGIDGRDLCKRARSDSSLSAIPFVILSAFIDQDGAASLTDLPADRCLGKRLPVAELVLLISEILDGSPGRRRSGSD